MSASPRPPDPSPVVVAYYQPRKGSREGVVVLGGEFFRTTGRLDAIGDRVFAWGALPNGSSDPLRLSVQCERTSQTTLAAEITAFGAGGAILLRHRMEEVPLVVT